MGRQMSLRVHSHGFTLVCSSKMDSFSSSSFVICDMHAYDHISRLLIRFLSTSRSFSLVGGESARFRFVAPPPPPAPTPPAPAAISTGVPFDERPLLFTLPFAAFFLLAPPYTAHARK